jgi:hypothetical protein
MSTRPGRLATEALRARLFEGLAIPAHPLALDASRRLDRRRQRALSRYYLDAGAGGLAVGVHTTQFAIREAGLFEEVLALAAEPARNWQRLGPTSGARPLLVAGACGRTPQATAEARVARELGYDAVLLSLAALKGESEDKLIAHCEAVGAEMPLIGFYLQPAVGGVALPASFWARFAAIDNVVAIKVAPFHRYRKLDVVRGLVAATALEWVAPAGTILVFADAGALPAEQIYRRELTVAGRRSASPDAMREALAILPELELPEPTVLPLDRFGEGLDLFLRRDAAKVVFVP